LAAAPPPGARSLVVEEAEPVFSGAGAPGSTPVTGEAFRRRGAFRFGFAGSSAGAERSIPVPVGTDSGVRLSGIAPATPVSGPAT